MFKCQPARNAFGKSYNAITLKQFLVTFTFSEIALILTSHRDFKTTHSPVELLHFKMAKVRPSTQSRSDCISCACYIHTGVAAETPPNDWSFICKTISCWCLRHTARNPIARCRAARRSSGQEREADRPLQGEKGYSLWSARGIHSRLLQGKVYYDLS